MRVTVEGIAQIVAEYLLNSVEICEEQGISDH